MKLTNREFLNTELISNFTGYDLDTVRNVLRGLTYLVNLAVYDENNEKNEVIIPFIGQVFFNITEVLKDGKKFYSTSPEIILSDFVEGEINKIKSGENSSLKDYHLKNIGNFISRTMEISKNDDMVF